MSHRHSLACSMTSYYGKQIKHANFKEIIKVSLAFLSALSTSHSCEYSN